MFLNVLFYSVCVPSCSSQLIECALRLRVGTIGSSSDPAVVSEAFDFLLSPEVCISSSTLLIY